MPDMGKGPASFYDWGHASFSTSAGARNAVAMANPLSPGGLNPRGVNMPTFAWVIIFGVVGLFVYHNVIKR